MLPLGDVVTKQQMMTSVIVHCCMPSEPLQAPHQPQHDAQCQRQPTQMKPTTQTTWTPHTQMPTNDNNLWWHNDNDVWQANDKDTEGGHRRGGTTSIWRGHNEHTDGGHNDKPTWQEWFPPSFFPPSLHPSSLPPSIPFPSLPTSLFPPSTFFPPSIPAPSHSPPTTSLPPPSSTLSPTQLYFVAKYDLNSENFCLFQLDSYRFWLESSRIPGIPWNQWRNGKCWQHGMLWMMVVVEEVCCGPLMTSKSSIGICQRSFWAWPSHNRIKWGWCIIL